MEELDKNEIGNKGILNSKIDKNEEKSINRGVLYKLHESNNNNLIQKSKIALIKSSNSTDIEELIAKLTNTSIKKHNIGIRKTIKIISGKVKTNHIFLYDYNYFVFNRYSYLRNEILKNCDIYVIICNIFQQKLDIFFTDFIEILRKSNEFSKKKIVILLSKSTTNFLMSMVASEQLISIKEQISFLFKNYKHFCMNIELNGLNVDSLLQEIINI